MKTLDNFFSRYGHPANEANETIYLYFTRADKIDSLTRVQDNDSRASQKISELLEIAELLKKYRKTLYDRAQEFLTAGYAMQLKITREIDCWKDNKKFYKIKVLKIPDLPNAAPVTVLEEIYNGKERHTALKRFESLKKLYPNIETIKDIDKRSYEK